MLSLLALMGQHSTAKEEDLSCSSSMKKAGLSDDFLSNAAHGIHSITLDDLKNYFYPKAEKENGIPTIDNDLTSDTPVLKNAPPLNPPNRFNHSILGSVDRILTNMDNKYYGVLKYSALEKVVHELHMHSIWEKTKKVYKKIKRSKKIKRNKDLCPCVKDIENNGIMYLMNIIAARFRMDDAERNPGVTETRKMGGHGFSGRSCRRYSRPSKKKQSKKKPSKKKPSKNTMAMRSQESGCCKNMGYANATVIVESELNRPQTKGLDGDGMAVLNNTAAWNQWKERMLAMVGNEKSMYDLAVFLYCMLEK